MNQLELLKELLGNPQVSDNVLQFYLDNAGDIICDVRHSDNVEAKYLNIQISIAIELFNKRGAEGEIKHDENGIIRFYEASSISPSLLKQITPFGKSITTSVRVV